MTAKADRLINSVLVQFVNTSEASRRKSCLYVVYDNVC
jgi:hypothetical protein